MPYWCLHAAVLTKNYKPSEFCLLSKIARAIEALHADAPKTEFFRDDPNRYMAHCILMAYALRDVLRKINLPASVTPCSLAVTREDCVGGSITHLATVGDPREERLPGCFNGHLVVRSGGLLIDPVAGQAGRIWNHWHTAMICGVARRR